MLENSFIQVTRVTGATPGKNLDSLTSPIFAGKPGFFR
jgi:hypothetical protein